MYEYFRSRAAVVEALCAVDLPLWAAEIEAGMAACDTAEAQIEAYVRGQLALAGDPRHRSVVAISELELDDASRERIRAAHAGLVGLVLQALEELGHPQPRLAAALLQGVVEAAVRQSERVLAQGRPVYGADQAADAATDTATGPATNPATNPATDSGSDAGSDDQAARAAADQIADTAVALALHGLTSGASTASSGS